MVSNIITIFMIGFSPVSPPAAPPAGRDWEDEKVSLFNEKGDAPVAFADGNTEFTSGEADVPAPRRLDD